MTYILDIKCMKFPGGELHVEIRPESITWIENNNIVDIELQFSNNDDLFYLALSVDAIRRINPTIAIALTIPYFPYARQDRATSPGTAFALKVATDFVNSLKLDYVYITDPHSVVLPTLLNNCEVIPCDYEPLGNLIDNLKEVGSRVFVVSPDAGAVKRSQTVAERFETEFAIASKKRDPATGKILNTEVFGHIEDGSHVIIVDDIADGSRTFIELAKVLKSQYKDLTLHLFVTFGIFSKGKKIVYEHFETVHAEYEFWNYGD